MQKHESDPLVELLTEELPPKALAKLGEAFAAGIFNGLKARDFLEADSALSPLCHAAPAGVTISNVRAARRTNPIREKVLPVSVALDNEGKPSAPLAKKLAALGFPDVRSLEQLERAQDGKAESFFLHLHRARRAARTPACRRRWTKPLAKLPIPKVMSYQRPDGATVQFVRPVHRLIALHGSDVVPVALLGLDAGERRSATASCRQAISCIGMPTAMPPRWKRKAA